MAYTPTVWKNGEFPPIDAEHLNKIEQGIANSAPGGFGWGDSLRNVLASDTEDTYETYCGKLDALLADMPAGTSQLIYTRGPASTGQYSGAGNIVAVLSKILGTSASLIGISPDPRGTTNGLWRMLKDNGVWRPVEWINPPMELGVEYRTTERYLGKPVYTQIVQFDNLSTNQAFAPGGEIFRAIGEYQYPDSSGKYIPNMPTNPPGGTMTADSPYMEFGDTYNRTLRVQLKSDSKCLGKSARVQMWYTK